MRFDRFTVDSGTRQLLEGDQHVHLTPKAFDLLCLLIERQPNVVSKADLHARIWPGVAVTDASLNVLVREIRQVIGDDAARQRFVRTASRVGYAFCGDAAGTEAEPPGLQASRPPSCWLVWHSRPLALSEGDNVIGRGAGSDIRVDDEAVSRRHARVWVDGVSRIVTIEDLDSTNGTYVGRARIKSRAPLADGDTIKFGTAALKVRLWSTGETETTRVRRGK